MERQLLIYPNAVLFTLGALLPIVNPLGSAPIFLSLTADLPGDARRRLAIVVARHAFLLLMAAMPCGRHRRSRHAAADRCPMTLWHTPPSCAPF